jgi:hypothetical protein
VTKIRVFFFFFVKLSALVPLWQKNYLQATPYLKYSSSIDSVWGVYEKGINKDVFAEDVA